MKTKIIRRVKLAVTVGCLGQLSGEVWWTERPIVPASLDSTPRVRDQQAPILLLLN